LFCKHGLLGCVYGLLLLAGVQILSFTSQPVCCVGGILASDGYHRSVEHILLRVSNTLCVVFPCLIIYL
jgi:hypothetical protein